MVSFFVCLAVLVIGGFLYSKVVERIMRPTNDPTPAVSKADGVDYMVLPKWKVFLIELLNIAGTGPIFGALMGAVFGPCVFLWVVLGSIFAGGVHDYMSGMMSIRNGGKSIPEITGRYMGKGVLQVMRVFSVVLLILVGAVFVTSPAMLLEYIIPQIPVIGWVLIILAYYLIACFMPIDKVIGRLYPIFGVVLIVMAVGVIGGIMIGGYTIPEIQIADLHPTGESVWPFMFITVACGAVSGFHSTQAPIMARCVETERESRFIFYGAMIAEGIIALIWAAAGVAFYDSTGGLLNALNSLGQSGVVYDISVGVMGAVGGILAVLGVVICPITSGDTAFRSARLIISDWFHIDQSTIKRRLMITIPLLLVGGILTQMDFTILWRYFSWSNQFLAAIVLWTAAVYLTVHARRKIYSFACAIPATFMSAVTCAYILQAKEGLSLSATFSNTAGIIFAVVCLAVFLGTSMRGTTKQRLLGAASDEDADDEPLKASAISPDSSVD